MVFKNIQYSIISKDCMYFINSQEFELCMDRLKKETRDLSDLSKAHEELRADNGRTKRYNEEMEKTLKSIKAINQDIKRVNSIHKDCRWN